MRATTVLLTLALLIPTIAGAESPALVREDLSACTLPHGDAGLPDRNARQAKSGYVLDFSAGRLKPLPKDSGEAKSAAEFFQRIREDDLGDLMFSRLNKGTFVAVSSRIADLGAALLSDFDGRELPRPDPVESKEERGPGGQAYPGVLEAIQPQHTYLVETAEGRYALLRLIYIAADSATVQYVYQPDGTRRFQVPKGRTLAVELPSVGVPTSAPATRPVSSGIDDGRKLLQDRSRLIPQLIDAIGAPATTPEQLEAKAAAIRILGDLRAEEAVASLLRELMFVDHYAYTRRTTEMYPALIALVRIGKASSRAAIEELAAMAVRDSELQSRIRLLATVIQSVEGDDVAAFLVRRRLIGTPARDPAALEQALSFLAKRDQGSSATRRAASRSHD